jgi:hypothetical protein
VFDRDFDIKQTCLGDFDLLGQRRGLLLRDRHHDFDGLIHQFKAACTPTSRFQSVPSAVHRYPRGAPIAADALR